MDNIILDDLRTYANLSGDELGEAISLMISLRRYEPYLDDNLIHVIDNELLEIHKWFKRNTRIVKKEIPKDYYYTLEYLDG